MSNQPSHIALRASSTPRFMQCPGSAFREGISSSGKPAILGTVAHLVAANIVRDEPADVEGLAALHDVDAKELSLLRWAAEFIWAQCAQYFPNAETEITLPPIRLESGDVAATITGTADIVSAPGDGTLRIADWKSGWREGVHTAQLKTYALLAYHGYMLSEESAAEPPIERVYASVLWMRNREIEGYWFDVDTLEQWEQLIADSLQRGAAGELIAGEHCGYCPVKSCPTMRQQIALFASPETGLQITPENVIELHHLRNAVEARCKDLKDAIKQYVSAYGPIAFGEGRELAITEQERRAVVGRNAWPLLKERFGEDAVIDIADFSKSDIENLAGADAPRGGKGKAITSFLDELEQANGLTTSIVRSVKITKSAE